MISAKTCDMFEDCFSEIITENTEISLPRSPASWVGKAKTFPISIIEMSCGGGMGGAHWFEYVDRIPDDAINYGKMLKVLDLANTPGGSIKLINPNYIVQIDSSVTLVEMKFTSTNPNFPQGERILRCLVRDGVTIKRLSEYSSDKTLRKGR